MSAYKIGQFEVGADIVLMLGVCLIFFLIYFFSFHLQVWLAKFIQKFSETVGVYSTSKEFLLQRYVYQHSSGYVAKLYNWVNQQLVALGLRRIGVSVFGYMMFWAIVAFIISTLLNIVLSMGFAFFPFMFLGVYVVVLMLTRVMVADRMERRESDIMDAIDLIVPEVYNGVKNAIVTYKDNFAPSVKDDFQAFITNIQDRGYSFADAMYILSDSLGVVFQDFAQKAIYFESAGEHEMVEIFNDITETNRLRRQLRDENNNAFSALKTSFITSVLMTFGYFIFLMITDDFSRAFFLGQTAGKILLLVIIGIVFAVLAYITIIKSKLI